MAHADELKWIDAFLADIKAPQSTQNEQFLQHWINRENVGDLAQWNYLATTEGGFGGHTIPGSSDASRAGVKWYPTLEAGASANAAALQENHPGYSDLLTALRSNTASISAQYPGLGTWSAGGYNSLTGTSGALNTTQAINQNPNAAYASQSQHATDQFQQALTTVLAQQNSDYARQEAGFQQQLLGLSQQGLDISRGALGRGKAETTALKKISDEQDKLTEQAIKQQRAMIRSQQLNYLTGWTMQNKQNISGQAASGNLFTQGTKDINAQMVSNRNLQQQSFANQFSANSRAWTNQRLGEQIQNISYYEKMAAFGDQSKNLNLLAQRYGISGKEIQARLQNQLDQIGAGAMMTVSDLSNQMVQQDYNTYTSLNPPVPVSGYAMGAGTGGTQQNNPFGFDPGSFKFSG
jgi:hypothetical protein